MSTEATPLDRLEAQLGWLLRTGVSVSALALSLGLIVLVVSPDSEISAPLLAGGLIVLMATPMLRVIVSMAEYVRMREWWFVLTTLVVLVELAAGVVYALRR